MKYEVIRDCMIEGKSCKVGSVVELSDDLARQMMGIGRVEPYAGEPVVENRAIGLDESAEKPKRRGRPPKVEDDRDSE